MDVSCIVLAGGRSSRLGQHKAQVIVGNKSLFQRVLSSVSFIEGEIIVVRSGEESFPSPSGESEYRVVNDIYPRRGPLIGILTGLKVSESQHNLVVACDMPFLNQALLRYMIQQAEGFDVVIPRLGDMVEPLHAVYSRSCIEPMAKMVRDDNLSVHRLLGMVKARYIETDEIERFDPEHLSFFNINAKADLERARKLADKEG